MRPAIPGIHGFDFLVVAPGKFPALVHVVGERGHARFALLPRVTVVHAEGLTAEDSAIALDAVLDARDRLLAAWLGDDAGRETAPDGPRACEASYDGDRAELCLTLETGARLTCLARGLAALSDADASQVADVAIVCGGEVLYWRQLGLYLGVAELCRDLALGASGKRRWFAPTDGSTPAAPSSPAWVSEAPRVPVVRAPDRAPAAVAPEGPGGGASDRAMVKTLIGLIFYRERLLDGEQVRAIAREQARLQKAGQPTAFGEVALQMGLLTPEQVAFALELQSHLAHRPGERKPLGVYFLESAVVTPSELLAALESQRETGRQLGDVLVENGLIDREGLEAFMARIEALRQPTSAPRSVLPTGRLAALRAVDGVLARLRTLRPGTAARQTEVLASNPTEPDGEGWLEHTVPVAMAAPVASEAVPSGAPKARRAGNGVLSGLTRLLGRGAAKPLASPEQPTTATLVAEPAIPAAQEASPPQVAEAEVEQSAPAHGEAATAVAAPPERLKTLLGIILEREFDLDQAQVKAIATEQNLVRAARGSATFGEVALRRGLVTAEQLKLAAQIQARLAFPRGVRKPLALVLLENGVVKPSQLVAAQEIQQSTNRPLGEILLEQGLITEHVLGVFLEREQIEVG